MDHILPWPLPHIEPVFFEHSRTRRHLLTDHQDIHQVLFPALEIHEGSWARGARHATMLLLAKLPKDGAWRDAPQALFAILNECYFRAFRLYGRSTTTLPHLLPDPTLAALHLHQFRVIDLELNPQETSATRWRSRQIPPSFQPC